MIPNPTACGCCLWCDGRRMSERLGGSAPPAWTPSQLPAAPSSTCWELLPGVSAGCRGFAVHFISGWNISLYAKTDGARIEAPRALCVRAAVNIPCSYRRSVCIGVIQCIWKAGARIGPRHPLNAWKRSLDSVCQQPITSSPSFARRDPREIFSPFSTGN